MNDDSTIFVSTHWLMRLHVWARRCAVVAAILALIAVVIDLRQEAERSMTPPLDLVAPAPIPDYLATRLERPRYRHSVIAGGAYSADELAAAMREDAVVAEHHRDLDTDLVHAVVTSHPRAAYVSYRIGHRVYWTRKPVHIPAGETLLTDGVHEVRARCGNGVSDTPREPVSDVEPFAGELDQLEDSSTTGERALVNTAPIGPAFVPFFHLAQAAALGGDAPGTPDELQPISSMPLGLSAFLLDPAGSEQVEPSARGTDSDERVSGGRPFLVGVSDPGGPGGGNSDDNGNNGGESNGGGNNNDNGNNDNANNGGGNDNGNNGGGNDNGNNGGGGNTGGPEDPGPTIPTTLPGSEDLIEDPDDVPQVPEPGTLMLVGFGLAAAVARRRRTKG